ncbi:hypothetical protein [Arthrobacter sp. CAL618]|uniref:hypothetical protein n=1 Tax=Arthrobacter sp. CAL618 TaxID=1055770 RepID=UPI0004233717|nr:hypothetical protein [Arthrobacter sp. CAL618]
MLALTYMPTYLEGSVGMVANTVLTLMFVGQIAVMLMIPLAGARSDKIGGKPMWFLFLDWPVCAGHPDAHDHG